MEPWYKIVTPRKEVRQGRSFNPDEFAIAMEQVVAGTAPDDYKRPEQFFARTCFTRALREHAGMVLRRLAGKTENTAPVLTLITQFGGGKTHTLTALYHLAKTGQTARPKGLLTELIVDNFAGAGGASLGIEAALGRAVDIGINHDALAMEVHQINHPETCHLCENVWKVKPLEATGGRPVGLAWFSPDCKHFSRAKGGKPLDKRIRALAWVVIRWAKAVKPRVIILENVQEFQTWGPLDAAGKPIKAKAGQTYLRWKAMLRNLGYEVETRELVAADYGVPTTRKRFFLIARCDGRPIVWPARTHAPRKQIEKDAETRRHGDAGNTPPLKPWRSAAECIDWSLPCPSIFTRKRPLAEATLRRIARGIRKYVIEASEPFIVCCNHSGEGGHVWGADEPLRTITGSRDAKGVVIPHVTKFRNTSSPAVPCQQPMPTATGGHSGAMGLVEAFLTKYHGPRPGDAAGRASAPREPFKTLDTQNRFGLVGATMVRCAHGEESASGKRWGNGHHDPAEPLPTVTASKDFAVSSVTLVTNTSGHAARDLGEPAPTLTSGEQQMLAAAHLTKFYGTSKHGQPAEEPLHAVIGQGFHFAEVRAFLVKYYGTGGQDADPRDPMHTLTAKARMGLVTVQGEEYQIADIGLRMLEPRELLRAQFGRFAEEYVLVGSKARQVAAIGNSVPPELAEAIVRANFRGEGA